MLTNFMYNPTDLPLLNVCRCLISQQSGMQKGLRNLIQLLIVI